MVRGFRSQPPKDRVEEYGFLRVLMIEGVLPTERFPCLGWNPKLHAIDAKHGQLGGYWIMLFWLNSAMI